MDRRQKLLLRLYSSVVIIGILSGCSTIPDGQTGRLSESSGPVIVDRAPEPAPPAYIAETSPDPSMPEASLPCTSPGINPGETRADFARGAITEEFHLSADTGWLVLPVPRISDDLALQYPPSPSDAISGLPLILPVIPALPVLPVVAAASSPPESEVDLQAAAEDDRAGSEDPREAVAVVARPAADPAVIVGLDVGIGSAVVPSADVIPPADVAPPAASQHVAGASIRGFDALEPAADTTAVILPAETEWSQRSATADPGSDTVITLPGGGWLYVGREYGVGIADLIVKRSVAGDDEFVFQFSESGDYGLWFQRQDPLTGRISNERLQVDASPGGSDQISVVSLTEKPPVALAGDPPLALEISPDEPAAIGAVDPVDGPAQWMETAIAASESGNLPVAVEFWQKVSAVGGADGSFARDSLFDLAVNGAGGAVSADAATLVAAVDALRAAGELDHDRLLQVAEVADAAGLYGNAAAYYAELSESGSGVAGLDAIYFRLASILEMPGPARDLPRARALYEMVIDRYPLSMYWDASAAQIEYLKRHYFEIR